MDLSWKTLSRVGLACFLLYLAIHYLDLLVNWLGMMLAAAIPLFLGCAIAYVLNILMAFYEGLWPKGHSRGKRGLCLTASILTVVALFVFLGQLVFPELIRCIQMLVTQLPSTLESLVAQINNTGFIHLGSLSDLSNQMDRLFSSFAPQSADTLLGFTATFLSTVVNTTLNWIIGLFFAIYLLLSKEQLLEQSKRLLAHWLPARADARFLEICSVANSCFHGFVVGQCTEAVILGALCALGMAILGLPYAGMTGVVVGFTALIPIFGAFIGGLVGFLLILTQSPLQALFFLAYLVILQQVEGNLIYPRVVGTSIDLPGIWVLAAVILGGGVGGILGMIFAVPLTAVVYRLIRQELRRAPRPTASSQ